MKRALAALVTTAAVLNPVELGLPSTNDAATVVAERKTPTDPRAFVRDRAARNGWTGRQWRCIDGLVYRESRWKPTSKNRHSSAYGLFQFLHMKPGTPLAKQYETFADYIHSRYGGTPCAAYAHSLQHNWY